MSQSSKHTSEPWRVHNTVTIHGPNGNDYGILAEANIYRTESDGSETGQANASRIVACVNACAGMDDPKEAIANAIKTLAACSLMFAEMKQTAPLEDLLDAIRKLGCK